MTIEGWQIVAEIIGHAAWPLLVATLFVSLRKPVYAFLSEAEEAGWGSAKVRRGNQRSHSLKRETAFNEDDDDDTDKSDSVATELGPLAEFDENLDLTSVPAAEGIRYYGRIVLDRLRRSKYNTNTTSARLGAEIVGTTYADLKQAVRMIAFFVGAKGGKRGPLPSFEVTLGNLALPEDLAKDILEARQLALDVATGIEKVDGQGSADYIDSVRALVKRLVEWGDGKITREPNLSDRTGQ